VAVVAVVLVAFWGIQQLRPKADKEKRERPPIPVLVQPAATRAVPLTLRAIGNVQAINSVAVRPQVTGPLTKVAFQQGQPVSKGQLLFEIDPRPFQASLDQAQAALARDRATAEQATSQAQRYAGLLKQGFVSAEQASQFQASAEAGAATVRADEATVENAKLQLSYTQIRSPIDGVAGGVQLTVGNLVSPTGSTPLVTINQVHPVYVSFTVPENQLAQVRKYRAEHPLTVQATPAGADKPATGTLAFQENQVDPQTGTMRLRATFPNQDGALVPGQFTDVTLQLDVQQDALTVPSAAVLQSQSGPNVFVLQPDNTVELRPVTLERQTDQWAVVSKGLQPGEQVVTDGQVSLAPGAKVVLKTSLNQPNPQGPGGADHPRKHRP
jgi:multidrug efflux system membrane fusion protein